MKDTIYFQTKAFSEVKEADNDEVLIEWFASTKDVDRYQDIVKPSAFKNAIEWFMKNPVMLLQHNQEKPIWIFTDMQVTSKWLKVKWKVTNDIDNVKQNIRDWILRWFSIWFIPKSWWYETLEGWTEVRVITEVELLEVSVVAVPANPFTLFQAVKKYFNNLPEEVMNKDNQNEEIKEEILDEQEVVEEEVEEVEEEVIEDDTHELHNSDNSENSDETTEGDKEAETEEAQSDDWNKSEEEVEADEVEDDWEADEDLGEVVKWLLEIVEKQAEIIKEQQSAIDKVGLKKWLATINQPKKQDSNIAWAKQFEQAKKNINY